ncbi:MAG: hypothetical protein MK085_12495, partial [Phycisphaerales bacterium]|nr:hypothetical protein [Phycisphaerales bacterium]
MNAHFQGNSEEARPGPRFDPGEVGEAVSQVVSSILQEDRTHHTSASRAPDAEEIAEMNRRLRWLAFPGFFGPRGLEPTQLEKHVEQLLVDLGERL